MCITALAWQLLPDRPVLLLSNRDEFYARAAAPLGEWVDSCIIAGQDCVSQGTWLGMTKQGRWAVLTNYREPPSQDSHDRSRGLLVTDYLHSDQTPMAFAKALAAHHNYAGFNLIVGDLKQAVVFSNRGTAPTVLASGVYTLSNGLIEDAWPKMERLRLRVMQEVLPTMLHTQAGQALPDSVVDSALHLLTDRIQAEDHALPLTGVSPTWEKALSSVFIQTPLYGTRVSSILTLDTQGYEFIEKTHVPDSPQSIVKKTGYWPES